MTKRNKISYGTLSIILLALSITLINVILKKQSTKKEFEKIQKEVKDLKSELDFISKKSEADELFIKGDFEKAMLLYEGLENKSGEKNIYEIRKQLIPETPSNNDSTIIITVENSAKIEELCNLHFCEINALDSVRNLEIDSIQNIFESQIAQLEKELNKEKNKEKAAKIASLNFYSPSGTKTYYFGEVKNDKANGKGMGHHATGSLYIGEWKNNLKHDKNGYYKWANNDWYEGEYKLGKRSGKGTYYWVNGEKYVGEWENDKRNGYGILYDKDGNVNIEGNWKNDEIIKQN